MNFITFQSQILALISPVELDRFNWFLLAFLFCEIHKFRYFSVVNDAMTTHTLALKQNHETTQHKRWSVVSFIILVHYLATLYKDPTRNNSHSQCIIFRYSGDCVLGLYDAQSDLTKKWFISRMIYSQDSLSHSY